MNIGTEDFDAISARLKSSRVIDVIRDYCVILVLEDGSQVYIGHDGYSTTLELTTPEE